MTLVEFLNPFCIHLSLSLCVGGGPDAGRVYMLAKWERRGMQYQTCLCERTHVRFRCRCICTRAFWSLLIISRSIYLWKCMRFAARFKKRTHVILQRSQWGSHLGAAARPSRGVGAVITMHVHTFVRFLSSVNDESLQPCTTLFCSGSWLVLSAQKACQMTCYNK